LHWQTVPLERQRHAFRLQLELAAELDRPVIVHDRDAHAEVMALLRAHAPPAGVVLHSFSGDERQAADAVAAGFWLGVDGPLTYKKNEALRAIFRAVPESRILIETDAPYLTPQPKRGRRNEPAYVRYVAETLAEVRGTSLPAMSAVTTDNAARLFRWE
jgi:TatD DNase family protein